MNFIREILLRLFLVGLGGFVIGTALDGQDLVHISKNTGAIIMVLGAIACGFAPSSEDLGFKKK